MENRNAAHSRSARKNLGNIGVWILQVLLAGLFTLAGVMKFVTPVEVMTQQIAFPGWFLHFIGACEIAGALGLILPAALRIRPGLTPLAAALLVPIMLGATVISVSMGGVSGGIFPFIVCIECAFVAVRRGSTARGARKASLVRAAT